MLVVVLKEVEDLVEVVQVLKVRLVQQGQLILVVVVVVLIIVVMELEVQEEKELLY